MTYPGDTTFPGSNLPPGSASLVTTKANGDPLAGTITPPSNYPNPVVNGIGMHSPDFAYGIGNASLDKTAPAAVTVSSPSKTTTTVALTWTAGVDKQSGIASYDVYQGATKVTSILDGSLSYTVTGLTTATPYTFTVKVVDGAGNVSVASNSLAVTTN
jgi:hypothetical protein